MSPPQRPAWGAVLVALSLAASCVPLPAALSPGPHGALRFERVGAGLPETGQWREQFDVADLDGDGRLDLAHGPPRTAEGPPRLFLGDGRGGFRPWNEASFPALAYDYGGARAGDLDGDGAADLVLAVHMRGLLALRGDGRGRFRRIGRGLGFRRDGGAFSSRALRLLDFDRDGTLDVLALGEGPQPGAGGAAGGGSRGVALFRGAGDGSFVRMRGAEPGGLFGRGLAAGDFDADGRPDFVTASSQLGRRDVVHLGRGAHWERRPVEALPPRAYLHAVAAADFDGDGRSDFAAAWSGMPEGTWRSGVDVFLSRPGGESGPRWLRVALHARSGAHGAASLATGDLDGDAAADLAALGDEGAIATWRGDGRGGFVRQREAPAPPAGRCRGSHLEVADLDGDGRGDLVASFAQEPGRDGRCGHGGGLAAWRSLP